MGLVDSAKPVSYDRAPDPRLRPTMEGDAMTESDEEALIADPAAAWDAAAPAWDEFVETGLDYWRTEVHGPALLAACGELAGRRALDIGCAQGWFSRQLAAHGGRVVGIDLSAAQIDNARRHEAARPLGIVYERLDAARIAERWPPESFDLIAACMSLHDTAHAGDILRAARQILAPTGGSPSRSPTRSPAAPTPAGCARRMGARGRAGWIAISRPDRRFFTGAWRGCRGTGAHRNGIARSASGTRSSGPPD